VNNDEVRFLPFEEAVNVVGAIQEEEDPEEPNHRIFTVYSNDDRELCWFDFDEVVQDVKPTKGARTRLRLGSTFRVCVASVA
jgi:hypothetical protein